MLTVGFYTNRSLAGKEIRFTAASNAFSSLAHVVAGNGCGPSLSEFLYLPMIPFWTNPPAYALQASFRGAKLELQQRAHSLSRLVGIAGSFNI
jgi:hypothetical protein